MNKSNAATSNTPGLIAWQKKVKKRLQETKKEAVSCVNEEYRDVLEAQEEKRAALKRITDRFEAMIDSLPGDRSRPCSEETFAAYEAAEAEMQRIANAFDAKWYKRLCQYVLEKDAVDKEYKRLLTELQDPATYQSIDEEKFWSYLENTENGGE